MPVPAQRDPDLTRDILAKWLGDPARLPGARITDLQTPEFSGFSSETLMVDVECGDAAEALAVRVAPLHYKVFPETRFAEEYRLMRILDSDTDIPVPPVLWYEPDPGYLGAPFLVMRRIEGRVPTDMPRLPPVLGHPPGRGTRAAGHPVAGRRHLLLALRAGAVRGSRDLVHRPGGRRRAPAGGGGGSGLAGRDQRVPGPAVGTSRRTPRAPGTW